MRLTKMYQHGSLLNRTVCFLLEIYIIQTSDCGFMAVHIFKCKYSKCLQHFIHFPQISLLYLRARLKIKLCELEHSACVCNDIHHCGLLRCKTELGMPLCHTQLNERCNLNIMALLLSTHFQGLFSFHKTLLSNSEHLGHDLKVC